MDHTLDHLPPSALAGMDTESESGKLATLAIRFLALQTTVVRRREAFDEQHTQELSASCAKEKGTHQMQAYFLPCLR